MNTTCCWTVFLSLFNWSINPAFAQYSNLNTGDMTVIAGAQWEFYQGDCSGQDISAHAVSGLGSTYEDRLLACATLCLDRSNCVAFNYPVPGNGTSLWHHQNCWMKHNPNRQESQYLGETCGLKNQDTYEYYTLIYATVPTDNPSKSPSEYPTANPTHDPTFNPTFYPSTDPTVATSDNPTTNPTVVPSTDPTVSPSNDPSGAPSFSPSKAPTNKPTAAPSQAPSNYPTRTPSDAPTSIPTSIPTSSPSLEPTMEPTNIDEETTYVVTSTTVLVTDTFTTFDEDYCDANMVQRKKFRARMKRKLSNNIFDPEGCQFCLCQEIGQSVCNNLFDFASWDQTVYEQVFNELCPMNEFADLMNENGEQCDWMQIRVKDESDITECGCSAFYCQDEAFNGSGANGLRLNNVLMVVVLVTFGVWM